MQKDKILITGGSGFIGTNLIEYLKNKNTKIISLDIHEPKILGHKIFWKKVDINNLAELKSNFLSFEPDYVIHLAATTDLKGTSLRYYKTNILGLKNIIICSSLCKSIKRVLFASTRLVCKIGYNPKNFNDYCPSTIYGESKKIGEQLLKKNIYHFEYLILRITSIWGPWFDTPYKDFFNIIKKNLYVHGSRKLVFKSYGYVGNTVFQLHQLISKELSLFKENTTYLCDYEPLEILEFANQISIHLNKNKKIIHINYFILLFVALFGDILKLLGFSFPLTTFRFKNLFTEMIHDTKDLEMIIPNLPYKNLDETVKITCAWMIQKK